MQQFEPLQRPQKCSGTSEVKRGSARRVLQEMHDTLKTEFLWPRTDFTGPRCNRNAVITPHLGSTFGRGETGEEKCFTKSWTPTGLYRDLETTLQKSRLFNDHVEDDDIKPITRVPVIRTRKPRLVWMISYWERSKNGLFTLKFLVH